MPYLLDTDHVSLVQKDNDDGRRLMTRLDRVPRDDVATSILTYQEQLQGWLAYLNSGLKPDEVLQAYERLDELRRACERYNVLPFDRPAQDIFESLRPICRRIGRLDLRIASIALATDSTLLTRNFADFSRVPGLRFEDWTRL